MASARIDPKNPKAYQIDSGNRARTQKTVHTVAEGMALLKAMPDFVCRADMPWLISSLAEEALAARKAEGSLGLVRLAGRTGYIVGHLGHRTASALTSKDIEAFVTLMSARDGYDAACRTLQVLGGIYREAVSKGVLLMDPTIGPSAKHKPAKPGPVTETISDNEEVAILANCSDASERCFTRLPLEGGLVQSELPVLRFSDFGRRSVTINRSITDNHTVVETQQHRRRQIPLPADLLVEISALRGNGSLDDLVFPGPRGGIMTVGTATARTQRLMFRAGILPRTRAQRATGKARFTIEHLADRAAVKWLKSGILPPYVAKRLGYASYGSFARKFAASLGAVPQGNPVFHIDRLLWPEGRTSSLPTVTAQADVPGLIALAAPTSADLTMTLH